MTDIHHHYAEGAEVTHVHDAAAAALLERAPDADTTEAVVVQAAATIAAAFVARNYVKHGDRGQYSFDTIVRMSVDVAEKIHAAVHATE